MEKHFMTLEQAETTFGKDSRWLSGNIVGGSLPAGNYEFGAIRDRDYSIENADGSLNEGKYPVIEVIGHGEMTGNQIFGTTAVPVNNAEDKPENYLIETTMGTKKLYRINNVPVNPQFTGAPMIAMLSLQGKKVKVTPQTAQIPREYPRGDERTKTKMLEIAKNFAPKQVYRIIVKQEETI